MTPIGNSTGNSKWGPPSPDERERLRREHGIGWHVRGGWCHTFTGDRNRTYFGWVPPADAVRACITEEARRQRGDAAAERAANLMLVDAADLFLNQLDDDLTAGRMSAAQRASYGQEIAFLLEHAGPRRTLRDFTAMNAPEQLFRPLRTAAMKRGTFAGEKCIIQIRRFFDWCSRVRRLVGPVFYADAFDPPTMKEKRERTKSERRKRGTATWTAIEAREILAAAEATDVHRYAQVLLTLNGGMGATDLAHLRDGDVDWQRGCIDTDRSKTLVRRVVPLWPITIDAMKASRAKRPKAAERQWDSLFFLTRHGRPLVMETIDADGTGTHRTDALKNWFYRVVNADPRQKWERKVPRLPHLKRHRGGYYTLRSVFAMLARGAAADPNLDAIIMGHRLPRAVMEHYLRGDLLPMLRMVTDHVHAKLFSDD